MEVWGPEVFSLNDVILGSNNKLCWKGSKMALEGAVMGCGDVSKPNESQHQYDPHFDRVRQILEPLEKRWSYVQDVVLWKAPFHSLCYLAGINCIFGYLTTDAVRHVCIVLTVLSLTLCFGEVRIRVSPILERGGIGIPAEGKSPENTVPFSGLCNKLAALWSCGALYFARLLELRTNSSVKFCGIIFIAFIAFSFAYQYLPLAVMSYIIVSALYLWPGIRYYGIHYKVRNLVRPFYIPITTQWEHSRTKRERAKIFKSSKGEVLADSDDDFASEINPEDYVTQSQTDEVLTDTASEILNPTINDICHSSLSQPSTDDSASEGKMTGSMQSFDESLSLADRQNSSSLDSQGFGGSATSPDSSLMFVEGMNFPSVSQMQGTGSFDLDDQDFMQGLEFPDIEDGYNSSTESLHLIGSENSIKSKKDRASQQQSIKVALPSRTSSGQNTRHRPTHMQSQKVMSSSGHSSFSDDFEVLDSSEADELVMQSDRGVGDPSRLGSAVTYLGKWLGYNN